MDELVERVREALAAEYQGAPNGRVREVPDRRAIRWYVTIGLVDRPLAMRGRTALYGPRHLEQLVAIKRRQSEGHSLARIQAEFTFLTPRGLADAAQVPEHLLAVNDPPPGDDTGPVRRRFWADTPQADDSTPFRGYVPHGPAERPDEAVAFRRHLPVSPTAPPDEPVALGGHLAVGPSAPPDEPVALGGPLPVGPASRADEADHDPAAAFRGHAPAGPAPVHGVALGGGAILLLPRPVPESDRADLAAAAAPLLDLLQSRGLIDRRSS